MPSWAKGIRKANRIWSGSGWGGLRRAIGGKLFPPGAWGRYSQDAMTFAAWLDFSEEDLQASREIHARFPGALDIRSLTWFLPEFEHAYYGGIHTILRFADAFKREKGVSHQFLVLGSASAEQIRARIAGAFPALGQETVRSFNLYEGLDQVSPTDAAIATLWGTAYAQLRFNQTRRKFYFLQDYEPLFYPAGSTSAQVEATYRFGYYGIANTSSIQRIYEGQYGGQAEHFLPCVDTAIFHPPESDVARVADPATLFFYGRPAHPRNGFELGAQALRKLKKRLGDRVRIVTAGDVWDPDRYGLRGVLENFGLLGYAETAQLYRACRAGLVMMFTRHPSYLPFEFMASGCLVVTNHNPATTWLLKDGVNCLLSESSATCLAETLEQALLDHAARRRITANALQQVQADFSDWEREIKKIYNFMCGPKQTT